MPAQAWHDAPKSNALNRPKQSQYEVFLSIVALGVGLLQAYSITFVGSVPLGELGLAICIPILFYGVRDSPLAKEYRTIYLFLSLWCVGQIISNYANEVEQDSWLKSAAALAFLLLDIFGLRLLLRGSPKRQLYLAVGLVVANVLSIYFNQLEAFVQSGSVADNWKFGWAYVVSKTSALVAIWLFLKRRYTVAIFVVLAAGVANLFYNARNVYLITVLSIILVVPVARPIGNIMDASFRKASAFRFSIVCALLGLIGLGLSQLYGYVAIHELVSEEATAKYMEQTASPFGIIVSARPELVPEIAAVIDSPLLGYGYHGKGDKYVEMYLELLQDMRLYSGAGTGYDTDATIIPAHSFLFCAWVWAGLLGALFWFYCLFISGAALFKLTMLRTPLSPYYSLLICFQIWDILCSPFGLAARMQTAFVLVITHDILSEYRQRRDPLQKAARFRVIG